MRGEKLRRLCRTGRAARQSVRPFGCNRWVQATLADAQRVRVEVNALGDAVEDGHLEVGVQLLLAREELIQECVHLCPLDARCDEFPSRRRSPGHERNPRAHLGLG
jgi:hypothetical protein